METRSSDRFAVVTGGRDGQPADQGTLDGVAVEDVQKPDGAIVHVLAKAASVADVPARVAEVLRENAALHDERDIPE